MDEDGRLLGIGVKIRSSPLAHHVNALGAKARENSHAVELGNGGTCVGNNCADVLGARQCKKARRYSLLPPDVRFNFRRSNDKLALDLLPVPHHAIQVGR